jgi:hypothetical protein
MQKDKITLEIIAEHMAAAFIEVHENILEVRKFHTDELMELHKKYHDEHVLLCKQIGGLMDRVAEVMKSTAFSFELHHKIMTRIQEIEACFNPPDPNRTQH